MRLAALKLFALLFLLPGLAGLIVSAMISTHYLATMPRWPVMEQHRFVPRGIHGITIYQTPEENRDLNVIEYTSVGIFPDRPGDRLNLPGEMGQHAIARRRGRIQACGESQLGSLQRADHPTRR